MEIIYTESSPYQHIMIIEEGNSEKSLVLDGYFQTSLPNNEYWACMLGPNTGQKTTILGGGDLTSIPELKRHGVSEYHIVELDKKVVEACSLFATVPRGEWGDKIVIGDAVAALKEHTAAAEHVIVDMLAMSRLGFLVDANPEEFLDLLVANASTYISGFTDAATTGIMLNTILQREFYKRGWRHFVSLINDLEECFFITSKEPIALPAELTPFIVHDPVYPKDPQLYEFSFNDALIILKEAK